MGYANNARTTNSDFIGIKFSSGANIEWVGIYISSQYEHAARVYELEDGGYLLAGYSLITNYFRTVILKISSTG